MVPLRRPEPHNSKRQGSVHPLTTPGVEEMTFMQV